MRAAAVTIALLALAACGSDVQSPAERAEEGLRPPSPVVADAVELRGEGLVARGEAFYFSAGQNEVETALAKVLGEPTGRAANDECGGGPLSFTDYAGGLTVNFQSDVLVGWNWRLPQDGDVEAPAELGLAGDVQLGTSRKEAQEAGGFVMLPGSTLGEEFTLGEKIGGFFDGDQVVMLYAGAQCFTR